MQEGTPTDIPGLCRVNETTWTLRVRVMRDGLTTQKRKTFRGTKVEAVRALALLQAEVEARVKAPERSTTTLGAWTPLWLKSLARKGNASDAFITTRQQYLKAFILPRFGHRDPATIRPGEIDAWKDGLLEFRKEDGKPYAQGTLQTVFGCLRSLMRWVTVAADLKANPMTDVRFDLNGPRKAPKESLTAAQTAALLRAAEHETPDIRAMLVLGFATGLRFCELSAVEVSDFDFERGTLEIKRSQVGGVVGEVKTAATARLIYLPAEVIEVVKAHLEWLKEESRIWGAVVFPSAVGSYRYPSVLAEPMRRCCEKAGIDKRLTSHCLRKTTNNLVRKAAGDTVARAMVGHATPEMTLLYSEVDRVEALAALQSAFDVPKPALRVVR